eukprot:1519547-Lingulodinium_polyedra.AAC.1
MADMAAPPSTPGKGRKRQLSAAKAAGAMSVLKQDLMNKRHAADLEWCIAYLQENPGRVLDVRAYIESGIRANEEEVRLT